MTTKNTQSILRQRRDRHLVLAIRRVIQDAHDRGYMPSMSEVAAKAVEQAAPGYYVEYSTAQQMMYRNVDHSRRSPLQQEMWREIRQKAQGRINNGQASSMARAVEDVLLQESASRYFISPQHAQRIYQRRRHRRNDSNSPTSYPLSGK
ncbi:MAG: hypothetical protein LUC85_02075 [Bacteroidales bacterium]|nr:hypothetical protein [Bacteroidales bacterium]